MALSDSQEYVMEVTERVVSVLSLIGSVFVVTTFLFDKAFHKPINRLVFYASWGNIITNVATLSAMSGIRLGAASPMCQFQGFIIQWFIPADALWIFAMAFNVHLTLFHEYKTANLQALEWRYLIFCYGLPFLPALTYCFIETAQNGKIYGPATLWCWISIKWDGLRIASLYGPAWIIIIATFVIHVRAGIKVFQLRAQLLHIAEAQGQPQHPAQRIELNPMEILRQPDARKPSASSETWTTYKRNYDFPTRKFSEISSIADQDRKQSDASSAWSQGELPERQHTNRIVWAQDEFPLHDPLNRNGTPRRRVPTAADANRAAINYCKCALLFFIALIVTWVPSSINRVYTLFHPDAVLFSMNYASAMVLPLQGFWNAVIYIVTSFSAFKALWARICHRTGNRLSFACANSAAGPQTPTFPLSFGENSTNLT